MSDFTKFDLEDFLMAVALTYIHSNGNTPRSAGDMDVAKLKTYYDTEPNQKQWLRFLLWAREINTLDKCLFKEDKIMNSKNIE